MEKTLAITAEYMNTRKQFGVPIAAFQALQHRAADLQVELEVTRGVVMKAQEALDAGSAQASLLASAAKARACATASRAVQEGVQMHGGMGMTDACEIGLFMKRARVAGELLGDEAFHLDRFARLRSY
jgi:alkylation response protein AidB-like acyl-CoA dehydrogenase